MERKVYVNLIGGNISPVTFGISFILNDMVSFYMFIAHWHPLDIDGLFVLSCSLFCWIMFFLLMSKHALGFHGGSGYKESACNAGDLGSIPGSGRSPGGGHGNPLQYSCLENPQRQRSLVGYSPWGCKESAMIEQINTSILCLLRKSALYAFNYLPSFLWTKISVLPASGGCYKPQLTFNLQIHGVFKVTNNFKRQHIWKCFYRCKVLTNVYWFSWFVLISKAGESVGQGTRWRIQLKL